AKMWNVSPGRVGPITDHTCRSDATISTRDVCHASARPITSCDRPQSRLYAPLEPPCRQKPLNIGLWNEWPRSTGVVRSTAWLTWRVEAMRLAGRTRTWHIPPPAKGPRVGAVSHGRSRGKLRGTARVEGPPVRHPQAAWGKGSPNPERNAQ